MRVDGSYEINTFPRRCVPRFNHLDRKYTIDMLEFEHVFAYYTKSNRGTKYVADRWGKN